MSQVGVHHVIPLSSNPRVLSLSVMTIDDMFLLNLCETPRRPHYLIAQVVGSNEPNNMISQKTLSITSPDVSSHLGLAPTGLPCLSDSNIMSYFQVLWNLLDEELPIFLDKMNSSRTTCYWTAMSRSMSMDSFTSKMHHLNVKTVIHKP